MKNRNIKVIITAAGIGKRMGVISKATNKALLTIGGLPIIIHSINKFETLGFKDIMVITGYQSRKLVRLLGSRAFCIFNPFYEESSILGSIWQARYYLQGNPFVFSTSDHFFRIEVLRSLLNDPKELKIIVQKKNSYTEEDAKVKIKGLKVTAMSKKIPFKKTDGEFGGMAYFGKRASRYFFSELGNFFLRKNLQGYVMDVIMAVSKNHSIPVRYSLCERDSRIEIDSVKDLVRARKLANLFNTNIKRPNR